MPARCRANKIEVSMKRLSKVLGQGSDGAHWFMCPACDSPVRIKGWQFDGNVEHPTFSPSVISVTENLAGKDPVRHVCHSFIRGGKIHFLDDCTHALKGQTVDLAELPEWLFDEEE